MKGKLYMSKQAVILANILALSAIFTQQSRAEMIPINNPGFEDFVLSDAYFTVPPGGRDLSPLGIFSNDTIPGWDVIIVLGRGVYEVEAGTFNPNDVRYPGEATEGQNIAYTNGPTISQILNSNLTTGNYVLKVDVGQRLDVPSPGYSISILAGGAILAQDINSQSIPSGEFITSTLTFDVDSSNEHLGEQLEIHLEPLFFSGAPAQVNFDNVRLYTTPIPGAVWLFISGILSLAGIKRCTNSK